MNQGYYSERDARTFRSSNVETKGVGTSSYCLADVTTINTTALDGIFDPIPLVEEHHHNPFTTAQISAEEHTSTNRFTNPQTEVNINRYCHPSNQYQTQSAQSERQVVDCPTTLMPSDRLQVTAKRGPSAVQSVKANNASAIESYHTSGFVVLPYSNNGNSSVHESSNNGNAKSTFASHHQVDITTSSFMSNCTPKNSIGSSSVTHHPDRIKADNNSSSRSSTGAFSDWTKKNSSTSRSISKSKLTSDETWMNRYKELVDFKRKFGHCFVPNNYHENDSLGRWVKRQRHLQKRQQNQQQQQQQTKSPSQLGGHYKKSSSLPSLTPQRKKLLDDIGFIWDSHDTIWNQRLQELYKFKEEHGHCKIPAKYTQNQELAIWAKRQRRQFKILLEQSRQPQTLQAKPTRRTAGGGGISPMTIERVLKLAEVGFVFDNVEYNKSALDMIMENVARSE